MRWASVADLMDRFDARQLGDLCGDVGARVEPADLPGNARAIAALNDAEGELISAITVGEKYDLTQVDTLVSGGDTYVLKLVCDLALKNLYAARNQLEDTPAQSLLAMQVLQQLRQGERVLAILENQDAGSKVESFQVSHVVAVDRGYMTELNRVWPVRRGRQYQ